MKKISLFLALVAGMVACAQTSHSTFDTKEVLRIESFLASDQMRGRKAGSPEIDVAATFIADEFKKAGLQPLANNSFLQEFSIVRTKFLSAKAEMDDVEIDTKNVIVVTTSADVKVNEKMGYQLRYLNDASLTDAQQLLKAARSILDEKKNVVVFVDTALAKNFSRLTSLKRPSFKRDYNVVFVLGNYQPKEFTIKAEHGVEEMKLKNVVGVLPGKSRAKEMVIFSGHYDHIGIGKPVNGDSIYNGANDDAAGVTAVMMLANYYKQLGNNERTLVFAAFTAEEIGGYGSQYFSQQLDAEKVVAMFNIEMIGTESKWGRNTAFITGYEMSDMGSIMQQSLKGSAFQFHPDPYPQQQLFYRSDNATLARLGVPAHTISTAKMENEPHYHQPSDEVDKLDLSNMTEIIKAIATSAVTIVNGSATPTRVKTESLR